MRPHPFREHTFPTQDIRSFRRPDGRLWKYVHELPDDWGGQFAEVFTGKHRNLAISGEHRLEHGNLIVALSR